MKITKRKIAWGVVLLILIVGGVICKKRWNVWFYNIPEIRYGLTEEPQRVFLTFGNDGELSRNVSWMCGGVSKQAKLEYTKIGSGDTLLINGSSKFLRTLGGFGYANWAKFKDLSYGDSYSYRVWNDDRSSDWYSFTMQPDSTDHYYSCILIRADKKRHKQNVFPEHVPGLSHIHDFPEKLTSVWWAQWNLHFDRPRPNNSSSDVRQNHRQTCKSQPGDIDGVRFP